MNEKHVVVRTRDGEMETFVAHPDLGAARPGGAGGGPFPVVVLYMDAPGIREELRGFARRIAEQGYYCLLPDLYYRRGRFRMTEGTPEESRRMFEHMESLSNALVLSDTQALLELVEGEEAASSGPKGCIGYCMSGQFVMSVAGTFPEHFKAGVSCYGVRIVTDAEDSPHLLASKVAGELLFAFAETDPWVPDGVIDTLRSALDEHGVAHHIETYPGTAHGFCFPERAGAYDEASAEQVWKRSFELFARRLS